MNNTDHLLSKNSTYIFDPEDPHELGRLINLDQLTTRAMGGPLAGLHSWLQETPGILNVLDLACGPGGWVLDVAFAQPDAQVAGVDISCSTIEYAYARARSQQIANASFEVMDITRSLNFPDDSFDLVNARFLVAVLKREAWKPFLAECMRVLRPGGVLRLTEPIDLGDLSSPSCMRLVSALITLLWQSGYSFSPTGSTLSITPVIPLLLHNAGLQQVERMAFALDVSKGTPAWADYFRSSQVVCYEALPLLAKANLITPEEEKHFFEATTLEMQGDDFLGAWNFTCFWGRK